MKICKAYTETNGYRRLNIKNHILASANGKVYEHRVMLFAVIGYGPHRCPECGNHINWGYGLETDHIDGNRGNNSIENLRPLCVPDNRARRRWKSTNAIIAP